MKPKAKINGVFKLLENANLLDFDKLDHLLSTGHAYAYRGLGYPSYVWLCKRRGIKPIGSWKALALINRLNHSR